MAVGTNHMTTAQVKPVLETMYDHRSEMVPCFIGAPGIGKTQGIYEFAEEKGVNVVTFILSNTVPSEVSGIRMPDKETKKMEVFDDMRMASLKDGDILFFDEILEAPPALWSACLTLIQDRIMASGRKLPDVFIVAASNKVATPGIIPASTRDRFMFIELDFDFAYWSNWFADKYGVSIPFDFEDKIEEDSDQYNILTPRRFVKLYTWLKKPELKPGFNTTKYNVISSMFDGETARLFKRMINHVKSPKRQILEALPVDLRNKVRDEVDVKTSSIKEFIAALQALPEWNEIMGVLATVELQQDDLDGIQF